MYPKIPVLTALLALLVTIHSPDTSALAPDQAREYIVEMKTAPRGPFTRIRWYCNDGAVLPPKAFACAERGGGIQHGEWSDKTKQLRDHGYLIANFLAGVDAGALVQQADFPQLYNQLLLEQFLIRQDDGWILRKARYYRGAYQVEDEAQGARELLHALLADDDWVEHRFLPLRAGARLLPWKADSASIAGVRQDSSALADLDSGFMPLKNKIHNRPDAEDAARVREYSASVQDKKLEERFIALADAIDAIYQADRLNETARELQKRLPADEVLAGFLETSLQQLADPDPLVRYGTSAQILAKLRDRMPALKDVDTRFAALQLSLEVELANYRASTELIEKVNRQTRAADVEWMGYGLQALYGVGLISARQLEATLKSLEPLHGRQIKAGDYKRELDYLAHVPAWGSRWLMFYFGETLDHWRAIEPEVDLFPQDQLRGSPLLFYSRVLDVLLVDANRLFGVRHSLFGEDLGSGLRALNPGLARGVLREPPGEGEEYDAEGIYLLPHTTAELPPVAGILTAGEGNPLSHVQLLARNLGIPNVAVDEHLIETVRKQTGKTVILAVSPGGIIELEEDHGQLDKVFDDGGDADQQALIRPDLEKLNLEETRILSLDELRASDSGRVVGPKAAKLGELHHHYPQSVTQGVAIPFGIFRQMLDQPMPGEKGTVFEWMTAEYDRLGKLPEGSKQRAEETESFRASLQDWVMNADPGDDFRQRLRSRMTEVFGKDGSYGVFIRSDTNVEDLPGFTGAGLNLTLPNVVGFDKVAEGIPRVWASPFSKRACAWRQSHMDDPENVYPAVLLLQSVPSEKSGVLVTQDIDTGDRNWLSVAVQEGVGGAVDGEAAESLRIDVKTGEVRLLAQATAPLRTDIDSGGGVRNMPVSTSDRVLTDDEIRQLIELSNDLPGRFPPIIDAQGNPAPADIEFGFLDGKLRLFQLRPFLESQQAQRSQYLSKMDAGLKKPHSNTVDLKSPPLSGQ